MARRPVPIKVKSKDLKTIGQLMKRGVHQARVLRGGVALAQLGQGITAPQVAAALPLTSKAIREIAHRYNSNGLEAALYDKQRPGAKPVLDDSQKQRIVAMVCSKPPEGRARWTVRLIVEEAAKRKLVPKAGRAQIRIFFSPPTLKPSACKKCCSPATA